MRFFSKKARLTMVLVPGRQIANSLSGEVQSFPSITAQFIRGVFETNDPERILLLCERVARDKKDGRPTSCIPENMEELDEFLEKHAKKVAKEEKAKEKK